MNTPWPDSPSSDTPNLPPFGLLKIEGIDAKKFLQGQLTCHMDETFPSNIYLGAHCNPQGRMISLFRLFLHQDIYCLQMPQSMIAIALQAFKKYAVFFKVVLSDASNQINQFNQIELYGLYPTIYPETSEKFLPHELGLQNTSAISFTKGCYTGQEIIARMHYRGKLKSQLCHGSIPLDQAPQRGELLDNNTDITGVVVDYYQKNNNLYDIYYIK